MAHVKPRFVRLVGTAKDSAPARNHRPGKRAKDAPGSGLLYLYP